MTSYEIYGQQIYQETYKKLDSREIHRTALETCVSVAHRFWTSANTLSLDRSGQSHTCLLIRECFSGLAFTIFCISACNIIGVKDFSSSFVINSVREILYILQILHPILFNSLLLILQCDMRYILLVLNIFQEFEIKHTSITSFMTRHYSSKLLLIY